MSAKISMSFGGFRGGPPVEKAVELFQGCIDAFGDMGLFQFQKLIDLVQVVRIYPNQGMTTEGQIVVEVVVAWHDKKRQESFIVQSDNADIRTVVRTKVVTTAKELAKRIQDESEREVGELSHRLG